MKDQLIILQNIINELYPTYKDISFRFTPNDNMVGVERDGVYSENIRLWDDPGHLEGETCNRNRCNGVIKEHEHGQCTCFQNSPCHNCLHNYGYCEECGWDAEDEPQP